MVLVGGTLVMLYLAGTYQPLLTMARVITLTLSPTIDKSTAVDKVVAEHKLSCDVPKFEPGGGGINVSRALMKLGEPSLAVFPSGGLTGQRLQDLLGAEGIAQQVVETESLTRENFIVVSRATNEQFRFGMPAPELLPAEQENLLALVKKMAEKAEYIVASGSLPHGTSPDFFARVAHIAHQENARLIVDTSGEALIKTQPERAWNTGRN
jgi:6-phosphofructokinase 2